MEGTIAHFSQKMNRVGLKFWGSGRRHTRFWEVSLDGVDIFLSQRFVSILKLGSRNFGVLVKDQTTV